MTVLALILDRAFEIQVIQFPCSTTYLISVRSSLHKLRKEKHRWSDFMSNSC